MCFSFLSNFIYYAEYSQLNIHDDKSIHYLIRIAFDSYKDQDVFSARLTNQYIKHCGKNIWTRKKNIIKKKKQFDVLPFGQETKVMGAIFG